MRMDHDLSPGPGARTAFGKPLGWTRGWAVVVTVWIVTAALLVAARVDVGRVTALSPREAHAIAAVQAAEVESGVRTAAVLQTLMRRHGVALEAGGSGPARPRWYAIDRPWERRVYVYWELPNDGRLAWTVDDDGAVTPSAETALVLRSAAPE